MFAEAWYNLSDLLDERQEKKECWHRTCARGPNDCAEHRDRAGEQV